jgi:hypothetical protein
MPRSSYLAAPGTSPSRGDLAGSLSLVLINARIAAFIAAAGAERAG